MHLWLNGRFVPRDRAMIRIDDRGFHFGDGIFETLRVYDGKPFLLGDHWTRFLRHARLLRMPVPFTQETVRRAIAGLVRRNRTPEGTVKFVVSRGVGGVSAGRGPWRPTAAVWLYPFTPLPESVRESGVPVRISPWRQNARGLVSHVKTLNYLERVFERETVRERGIWESIFLSTDVEVAEGTFTNVFGVRRGRVFTPRVEARIRPGVTRQVILALCRRAGIPAAERRVSPQELKSADEVFLTHSPNEVVPVTRIDGRKIGTGRPGPITLRLEQAYRSEVDRHCAVPS